MSVSVPEAITVGIFVAGLLAALFFVTKRFFRPDSRLRRFAWAALFVAFAFAGGLVGAGRVFVLQPVAAAGPDGEIGLGSEVSVTFDRPINQGKIDARIEPEIKGEWVFEDPTISKKFARTVTFKPTVPYLPATEYTITLASVSAVAGVTSDTVTSSFKTAPLPSVKSASVEEGAKNVSICEPFTVTVESGDAHTRFEFALEPEVALEAVEKEAGTYVLTPERCLSQGASYTLLAKRFVASDDGTYRTDAERVWSAAFTTKPASKLTGIDPAGSDVVPSKTKVITATFSEPMDTAQAAASVLSLTPATAGSWAWSADGSQAAFTVSSELDHSTTYTVAVAATTKDAKGGHTETKSALTFKTATPPKVTAVSPSGSGLAVTSKVKITFDKAVDHASAEKAISFSPDIQGSFSWSGNSVTFSPSSSLAYDTTYRVSVAAGIVGETGLISAAPASGTFATEDSKTLLNVAVYRQKRNLSCELAAARMALLNKGVDVSEDTLLAAVGYSDPNSRSGGTWGDPNEGFVGSVNGQQNTTGYGVHWGPVASAVKAYRPASAFAGWSAAQLASAIADGNAVVIWGTQGTAIADSWVTPAGKTITTWKGEHARTAVGFTGPASAPKTFIINDPISGRIEWTTAQLLANWGRFNNSGVVVY